MRKLLVALMIVAFAATAFADVKLSGYYNVNGIYKDNISSADDGTTEDINSYYEHEFKIKMKATTDKDTYFNAKLEIADNTWDSEPSAGYQAETTNFQVERAYLGHNFGVAKLDVGLMDGGGWSYSFGNNVEGMYRIKATIPAGPGNVIAIIEKNYEANASATDSDSEKDDTDGYILSYSGKVAGLKVAPLLKYQINGNKKDNADHKTDMTVTVLDLGVGGQFGAVGFEAEVAYKDVAFNEGMGTDFAVYGVYGNVFTKVSGAKVGFITAYSSYDEDANAGYDMADDFDDSFGTILGDEGLFGAQSLTGAAGYTGLAAMWLNGVYGEYKVNDKLTLTANAIYAMSTIDDSTSDFDGATAIEFDVFASYAITDALSYDVYAGYVIPDTDDDMDPAYMIKHGLTLNF